MGVSVVEFYIKFGFNFLDRRDFVTIATKANASGADFHEQMVTPSLVSANVRFHQNRALPI